MIKISCDICNKEIKTNSYADYGKTVTVTMDGNTREYDLCDECKDKLQKLLNTSYYSDFDHSTPKYKIVPYSEVIEENKSIENSETTTDKVTNEQYNNSSLSREYIEEKVAEALKLHEQYMKRAKHKKRENTKIGKIEEYGIEKFAREYLGGKTSAELEAAIGVSRFTVIEFVKKYSLQKRHRATKTEPSKEDN